MYIIWFEQILNTKVKVRFFTAVHAHWPKVCNSDGYAVLLEHRDSHFES